MKVILGLGNPGLKYKFSRHNLGFLVVEKLAKSYSIKIKKKGFNYLWGKGLIGNQEVFLGKPLSFMNLSGETAASIVKQKKIELKDLLIVLDDVNLPLGKIRIRPKGSDGGHKGLRSIIEAIGSGNFSRLRIGIGVPQSWAEKPNLTRHVLGRFNKREIKIINAAVEEAQAVSEVWIRDGIASAMNRYNPDKLGG